MKSTALPEHPGRNGYRMPAEWETHRATWLAWPHRKSDWPGKFTPIPWVYAEIIRNLSRYERVELIVTDSEMEKQAVAVLNSVMADLNNVGFWKVPNDRSWVRDSGPTFLVNDKGDRKGLDWHFNGWAKYQDWKADDKIPGKILPKLKVQETRPMVNGKRVVLEGGAIDVNGAGMMLTTEECLLSTIQERNPGLKRSDYEQIFADYLGVKKTIWLNKGIDGDDTHGHIDDLARFVAERKILCVREPNKADPNHGYLEENWQRLQGAKDANEKVIETIALPMPQPIVFRGQRLPASYANFYIANNVVLVPLFNDVNDRLALNIIAEQFPGRDCIGIFCGDLILGLGTLHCMTQQEPQ